MTSRPVGDLAGTGRPRTSLAAEYRRPGSGEVPVEVRRSARRRRTVSAYREAGRIVVLVPAGMPASQERQWVDRMVARLAAGPRRRSDEALAQRAKALSAKYLDSVAEPTSVAWSTQQGRRWGSCTVATGAIRLSSRLQGVPDWVVDYVLLHELAHLLVADHSAAFWALVQRYPRAERARGFLDGLAYGQDAADRESR